MNRAYALNRDAPRQTLQPMVVFLHGDIDPCAALIILNQSPNFAVDTVNFRNQFFLAVVSGDAALRKTNLTPGYLIRYADDFVIVTDTRAHAECWKARLEKFLHSKIKLTLSKEKTLITDVRKKKHEMY